MSHVRPMTEVASAYDQWARTYETVENATRDLAATVLRHYPLHLHDRDVLEMGGPDSGSQPGVLVAGYLLPMPCAQRRDAAVDQPLGVRVGDDDRAG